MARRDDHSSSPDLATGIERPTRGFILRVPCSGRSLDRAGCTLRRERTFFRTRSASRAGSPLLFGLAPRGVCLAAAIADGAVGSYPTFSPLPACVPYADIPKVFLRTVTGFRTAGGMFSVALSVNRSIGFSLRGMAFTVSARLALQTEVYATAPLALPGASPITLKP